ncbi:MAG: hypothetical protein ABIA91_00705 [Patescibacteria group bacterium]
MNYRVLKIFSREFKKMLKKYRTLEDDLENFKERFIAVDLVSNKNFAIVHQNDKLMIIKSRLYCQTLKGQTLRIIFAYYQKEKIVEFIEIYFKGNKENEDKQRIKEYLNYV